MFVFIDFHSIKEWLLVDHTVLNVKNKFLGMITYQFYLIYLFKENVGNVKRKFQYNIHLVELLSVLSFVAVYFFYGITITTLLFIILALIFIIIFFVDLKHYIIPNSLTFPLMVLGFVKSFDPNLNEIFPNYINSLIGGVFGYGIIWSIIFLYKVLRNKEGMGLGDAKLLAAIGFWFGWISIPFVIFSSSIVALIAVLPSLINKSKKFSSEIPFGPFIIIGCILYIIFIEQYKNLLFG
jgi:leader peptidase (prepilin peptidase)/N-methyltransferase